jgi:hypothetical protein
VQVALASWWTTLSHTAYYTCLQQKQSSKVPKIRTQGGFVNTRRYLLDVMGIIQGMTARIRKTCAVSFKPNQVALIWPDWIFTAICNDFGVHFGAFWSVVQQPGKAALASFWRYGRACYAKHSLKHNEIVQIKIKDWLVHVAQATKDGMLGTRPLKKQ